MSFVEILQDMNQAGEFELAVLVTEEGLPVASAPDGKNSESTAALAAMLQQVSRDVQEQLNLKGVDEVTVRDGNRYRLVCRGIEHGGELLILAVYVPPGIYYRRVTNRAIKRIRAFID